MEISRRAVYDCASSPSSKMERYTASLRRGLNRCSTRLVPKRRGIFVANRSEWFSFVFYRDLRYLNAYRTGYSGLVSEVLELDVVDLGKVKPCLMFLALPTGFHQEIIQHECCTDDQTVLDKLEDGTR